MANNLNLNASITGQVNGLNINQTGNASLTPTGSLSFAESVLIPTTWSQLYSASVVQPVGQIFVANQSLTGSVSFAISASGIVSNIGTVGPASSTSVNPSLIQWNSAFSALYGISNTTASYAIVVVAAQ